MTTVDGLQSSMRVMVLGESGYEEAIHGLRLSHGVDYERAREVALTLSQKDGGHNKFLESIIVWLDVNAPRHWWQEADTYRISTKQSESTMHTIHKWDLVQEDFDFPIESFYLDLLNEMIRIYREDKTKGNLLRIKNALPEGFLQRRIWMCSYKTLRNVFRQRRDHRQPGWSEIFVPYILNHIKHPEFL